jgi:adenine-specific DNA-methyltransferase
MILGDSLQVMASLAEREGLRGKVQCIYFDPPYGIKFNSQLPVVHHQPRCQRTAIASPTTSRASPSKSKHSATPGATASTATSPILRDRLTVARDLLTDSGSASSSKSAMKTSTAFAQNFSVMDEMFGDDRNCLFVSLHCPEKRQRATVRSKS